MSDINEIIKKIGLSDNEDIVQVLIDKHNFPSINLYTENIRAVNFAKINEYYQEGYFLFEDIAGNTCYAVNNIYFLKAKKFGLARDGKIFLIKKADLYNVLIRDFEAQNTAKALNLLSDQNPNASAKNIYYPKMVVGFLIIFFTAFTCLPVCFNIINNLIYFLQNLLKVVLFSRSIVDTSPRSNVESKRLLSINEVKAEKISTCSDRIPIYSVLVPLYNEEMKAASILLAIEKLNYPKDKLDVKFIVEADDQMTIKALAGLFIPDYIHVVKVPYSLPRTKPKALNFAMSFVKGKYLAVYDAEDEPDPDQLLKAVVEFNNLPEKYICLQSKLNFYNARENFLTKFFSIEYSIWFEYLLKGLSLFDLPVTLGGTSNHFKVDELKEIGLWDPYNVTEDAELGIRLYLAGYRVGMIDSITMEEAPNNFKDWLGQRSRWIKGFIQTVYIFLKIPKNYKKLGMIRIFTVYIFVGMSTYSFFFLPWLMLLLYLNFYSIFYHLWLANSIFSLIYMYAIVCLITLRLGSFVKIRSLSDIIMVIGWPLYFLLHSVASYRALWEIIISPFKWNKTPHGSSNIEEIIPMKE